MRKEFPVWRHHGYSYCRVMGLVLIAYLWSLKWFLWVPRAWCQIANRWTSKETRWKYSPHKRRPSDRYGSWCSHCCHHEWSVERTIKLPDAIAVSGNIELAHRSSYQLALHYVAVSSPSWCDATLTKIDSKLSRSVYDLLPAQSTYRSGRQRMNSVQPLWKLSALEHILSS